MNIEQLATELAQRRMTGKRGPALADGPQTLEQGADLQQACIAAMAAAGVRQIGWKCALPPADKWVFGPLYARETFQAEGLIKARLLPEAGRARIEPELLFVLAQDLPARAQPWTQAEVDAAIGSAHMAIELIGTRFDNPADCAFPALLADGVSNQGLIIGPQVNLAQALAAKTISITFVDEQGREQVYEGQHPSGLPTEPIVWFANFLSARGRGLKAGDKIITGTYAGVLDWPLGSRYRMQYQGLGELEFRLDSSELE